MERSRENIFSFILNRQGLSLIRQLARIRLKPIARIVTVFTAKREENKRQQLALITIVIILLQMTLVGYYSIFSLYLYGRPLCLDALHVSLLATVRGGATFLLSTLTAFWKKTFDKTYFAAMSGSFAFMVSVVIFGLAKSLWLLYVGETIYFLFFVYYDLLSCLQLPVSEVSFLLQCLCCEPN